MKRPFEVALDIVGRGLGNVGKVARLASSILATAARWGNGASVGDVQRTAERRIVLYEMESCPFSRKVRESLSILDLDVDIRPSPEGGRVHRRELEQVAGEEKVPYLIDPNTAEMRFGSDAIVRYLFETYGDGRVPLRLRFQPLVDRSSKLASALRRYAGEQAVPAKRPIEPLELWSYEAEPRCRLVREVLGAHELPYVLHNVARGSPKRAQLEAETGSAELPYLVDPNTGTELRGAERIIGYLRDAYGARSVDEAMRPVAVTVVEEEGKGRGRKTRLRPVQSRPRA